MDLYISVLAMYVERNSHTYWKLWVQIQLIWLDECGSSIKEEITRNLYISKINFSKKSGRKQFWLQNILTNSMKEPVAEMDLSSAVYWMDPVWNHVRWVGGFKASPRTVWTEFVKLIENPQSALSWLTLMFSCACVWGCTVRSPGRMWAPGLNKTSQVFSFPVCAF